MSTEEEKEKSLIDELIELKFKKKDRTQENITNFLDELVDEVKDLIGLNDEESDEDSSNDGFTSRIQRDDFPDDIIPFMVLKKDTTFLDYTCPHCSKENKFSIKKFEKSQFKEFECPDCHKSVLVKLEFDARLKSYKENN